MSSSVCVAEKKIKIGINGIGTTGRSIARAILQRNDVELVAFNDPFGTVETLEYCFENDNEFIRTDSLKLEIRIRNSKIFFCGEKLVRFYRKRNPKDIPWGEVGADVVVECTGLFTDIGKAAGHLKGGAKKVIIAAPSEDAPMFVVGVNDHEYTSDLDVVSSGSSTINCLAPLAKVINDRFGIVEGLVTTIHSTTATQKSVEAGGLKKDIFFEGLSDIVLAGNNEPEYMDDTTIEETALSRVSSSCAAKDVYKVIPSLNGKLAGMSLRVPTLHVSILDLTIRIEKAATYDEIRNAIKEESDAKLKAVLGSKEDDIEFAHFSHDIEDDTRSCIFDPKAGIALSDNFVKIVAWYNNLHGYSYRVIDLVLLLSRFI